MPVFKQGDFVFVRGEDPRSGELHEVRGQNGRKVIVIDGVLPGVENVAVFAVDEDDCTLIKKKSVTDLIKRAADFMVCKYTGYKLLSVRNVPEDKYSKGDPGVYGWCPKCGEPGVSRLSGSANGGGDYLCINGHRYTKQTQILIKSDAARIRAVYNPNSER